MAWVVTVLVLGVVGALVWASASIRSGVYLKALCEARGEERKVALTFDDGPDEEMTPRLIELLRCYKAKATFFVVGDKARQHPELVQRLVAEGHTLGNHTLHHSPFSPLCTSQHYYEELFWGRDVVARLTGRRMKLYRPPFGVTNPPIARAVKALGLTTVGWSVRSLDTTRLGEERVLRRIEKGLKPGAVILLHDGLPQSDRLLEKVLQLLEIENYKAVTVDELFAIDAYEK